MAKGGNFGFEGNEVLAISACRVSNQERVRIKQGTRIGLFDMVLSK